MQIGRKGVCSVVKLVFWSPRLARLALAILRVRTLAGEGLVALDLATFLERLSEGVLPVRALKQHLCSMCGLSRFRQRLVSVDDAVDLDDEGPLRPGEVQLVSLSFCQASDAQVPALRDAARGGLSAEVEALLQRPQDPDLGDPAPLFEASEQSHTEVVRLLLEANADKDKANHYGGETPLVVAAEFGCLEVARLLLEANADKDKETRDGATPLFMAALNGQLEVARLLLESNADKDKTRRDGATPLFVAAEEGHLEVARLLLQANAGYGQGPA